MASPSRTSYAAGHFKLEIDGHKSTAFVKSVEGGWSRANITDDSVGPDGQRIKQITTRDIDPITVEFGLAGANDMLKWIQSSWKRKPEKRHGQITHADFDMRAVYEHEFVNACVTETTFPTLDGSSKESGYIKCKLQPEYVMTRAIDPPGPKIQSDITAKQKMWNTSSFELVIDGLDEMKYVNKVDSFTITQDIQKLRTGKTEFFEVVPHDIKFPSLTGTISLEYTKRLHAWHQRYIRSRDGAGVKDPDAQKSGSINFLSPDRKQVIFRINLYEVGLAYLGIEPSKANDESIKRMKFELYVTRMELDGSSILGFA
jgi:tail tube protein gp19